MRDNTPELLSACRRTCISLPEHNQTRIDLWQHTSIAAFSINELSDSSDHPTDSTPDGGEQRL